MDTKLECTICRDCCTVSEWNETNDGAVMLGTMEKYIPEEITVAEWERTKEEYGSRMDCPSCGGVCVISDMDAY